MKVQLIQPSIIYKESYLSALEEGKYETRAAKLDEVGENESFSHFVDRLNNRSLPDNLPQGWVPETILWLIDNNEFIGRASIRHNLNPLLLKEGGNIGYYIRPGKRRMGYGKKILELAIQEAEKLGIKEILVTCDINNIGSKKIIEANGGILENIVELGDNKPLKGRYWIKK